MNIDKFLSDEQDVKTVEKVIIKLTDLLTSGEELLYLAVQKKPAVNLMPDSIAISNKRIFYCEPGNLGLTMNFKDISWRNIKEVSLNLRSLDAVTLSYLSAIFKIDKTEFRCYKHRQLYPNLWNS